MPQSYTRISNDGLNKSGKTCTMAQLAVGLSKEYGGGAPVHVFDSSDRWRTWKKLIFDVERIPLEITYGESILVLQQAMEKALRGPCSVFVADDLTVPWMEGVESFSDEYGNLTFERRAQLLREWKEFVRGFRRGPFDSLACGRLGYVWENLEDPESGKLKLHQGDSKFNAGGGENFGYDCELEIEMRRRKRKVFGFIRGKTAVEHVCDVIGDAHSILNGQQFVFPDWNGPYKSGMYRTVLDEFRPHIEFVRSLANTIFTPDSSRQLIVSGKTAWAEDLSERKKLIEEYDYHLEAAFPGGEGKSKLAKMFVNLTTEFLTGSISHLRLEEETPSQRLREIRDIAARIRQRVTAEKEIPTDHNGLLMLVKLAQDDVLHPGKHITLYEAMGLESVSRAKCPQPVVAVMDRRAPDEIAGD